MRRRSLLAPALLAAFAGNGLAQDGGASRCDSCHDTPRTITGAWQAGTPRPAEGICDPMARIWETASAIDASLRPAETALHRLERELVGVSLLRDQLNAAVDGWSKLKGATLSDDRSALEEGARINLELQGLWSGIYRLQDDLAHRTAFGIVVTGTIVVLMALLVGYLAMVQAARHAAAAGQEERTT